MEEKNVEICAELNDRLDRFVCQGSAAVHMDFLQQDKIPFHSLVNERDRWSEHSKKQRVRENIHAVLSRNVFSRHWCLGSFLWHRLNPDDTQ